MYCTCIQLYDLEVIYGSCVNSSGIMASIYDLNVSYSKKLSPYLRFCGYLRKFLREILGTVSIGRTSEQSTKVFFAKIVFSANSWKFSPSKVLCYMVWLWMYCWVLSIFLSWRAICSNKIIEGSCVNSADIMASICALECTRQFECYKYNMQQDSGQITKYQAQSTKTQYTQL